MEALDHATHPLPHPTNLHPSGVGLRHAPLAGLAECRTVSSEQMLAACYENIRFLSQPHLLDLMRKITSELDYRIREGAVKRPGSSGLPPPAPMRPNRPGDIGGSFLG